MKSLVYSYNTWSMPMFNLYCHMCLLTYHLCMCFCVSCVINGNALTPDCLFLSCAVSGIGMIMFRSKLYFIAIL